MTAEAAGEENEARRAVFLDRDGTIVEDVNYLSEPGELRLLDGAEDALRRLQQAGFLLLVTTN
ncbi:MAG: HAD family hydrolase, partial [Planctomycetota bacterium]